MRGNWSLHHCLSTSSVLASDGKEKPMPAHLCGQFVWQRRLLTLGRRRNGRLLIITARAIRGRHPPVACGHRGCIL
jgi:hypothetical protein